MEYNVISKEKEKIQWHMIRNNIPINYNLCYAKKIQSNKKYNTTQHNTSTNVEITIPRDMPSYPIEGSPVACK